MDIKGRYEFLKRISKVLSSIPTDMVLKNFNSANYKLLQDCSVAMKPDIVREIALKNVQLFSNIDSPLLQNKIMMQEAMTLHWDTIAKIAQTYQTPELKLLSSSLLNNQTGALSIFLKSINQTSISAANMAFIKAAKIFEIPEFTLPKGLASIIRDVNIGTAEKLKNSSNIKLDITQKVFYIQDSPSNKASILETNVAFSALDILPDITEEESIVFINELENNYAFANTSYVGKKVKDIVANWNRITDFDYDYFYHGRPHKENQDKAYTDEELKRAPSGVTYHGRYNHVGENHYYFSNERKGVILELKKHSTAQTIQIAKLKPKKHIKMVDFSKKVIGKNKFLEYCRMPFNNSQELTRHREYLFPCYVASCCRVHGIEGIKYYGSKEYKNYVSWQDDYFDIVENKVENIEY